MLYLAIPIIFAMVVYIVSSKSTEYLNLERLVPIFIYGSLFYATPYLLWATIVVFCKPKNKVAHSGFLSITLALALVASFWFLPPDPSGLPMQWMLYWPLAIILLFIAVGGTLTYLHIKAPNQSLHMDAAKRRP